MFCCSLNICRVCYQVETSDIHYVALEIELSAVYEVVS